MLKENRLEFSIFFLVILIGSWFILDRFIPEFHVFAVKYAQFPEILILIGGVAFFFGILLGSAEMFIPAIVIGGVGWVLSYQKNHGGYSSNLYMWALLPAFIGAGMLISGLFEEEDARQNVKYGLVLLVVGAILFITLAVLFGGWSLFGIHV